MGSSHRGALQLPHLSLSLQSSLGATKARALPLRTPKRRELRNPPTWEETYGELCSGREEKGRSRNTTFIWRLLVVYQVLFTCSVYQGEKCRLCAPINSEAATQDHWVWTIWGCRGDAGGTRAPLGMPHPWRAGEHPQDALVESVTSFIFFSYVSKYEEIKEFDFLSSQNSTSVGRGLSSPNQGFFFNLKDQQMWTSCPNPQQSFFLPMTVFLLKEDKGYFSPLTLIFL